MGGAEVGADALGRRPGAFLWDMGHKPWAMSRCHLIHWLIMMLSFELSRYYAMGVTGAVGIFGLLKLLDNWGYWTVAAIGLLGLLN